MLLDVLKGVTTPTRQRGGGTVLYKQCAHPPQPDQKNTTRPSKQPSRKQQPFTTQAQRSTRKPGSALHTRTCDQADEESERSPISSKRSSRRKEGRVGVPATVAPGRIRKPSSLCACSCHHLSWICVALLLAVIGLATAAGACAWLLLQTSSKSSGPFAARLGTFAKASSFAGTKQLPPQPPLPQPEAPPSPSPLHVPPIPRAPGLPPSPLSPSPMPPPSSPKPPPPLPPPPPRPSPPPRPGTAVVAELNARFANAEATNDLWKAGVAMRGYDGLNAPDRPWEPCVQGQHCERFRDRFATSIVYPGHPQTYSTGGLVLRPEGLELNCAYAHDGGSQGSTCWPPGKTDACIPGCKRPCNPEFGARNWGCSWDSDHLREMILQQKVNQPKGGCALLARHTRPDPCASAPSRACECSRVGVPRHHSDLFLALHDHYVRRQRSHL